MAWAVNVVFSPGGKVYSFDPNGLELAWDERVICGTSRGPEIARVVTGNHELERSPRDPALRPIERRATPADEQRSRPTGRPGARRCWRSATSCASAASSTRGRSAPRSASTARASR